jgi:fructan beta-fructosidase
MKSGLKLLASVLAVSLLQSTAHADLKTREIEIKHKMLLVPVSDKPATPGAKKKDRGTMLEIRVGETLVHKLNVVLADSKEDVAWWGYLEMDEYVGKTAKLSSNLDPESKGLDLIEASDTIRNPEPLYKEELRPRFHFMQKQGWNNDPNGMVYFDGEYHLFWQCGPLSKTWANMYWGHAVSKDMIHWEELPRAMRPFGGKNTNRHPSMAVDCCFSGSANIDDNNILGVQKGDVKTMVAAYTDTGCGEVLAYSTDRGRNWVYDQKMNPVIKHGGRDPKLIWYEPGKHWVIAVYDEKKGQDGKPERNIAIYNSIDLKQWTLTDNVPGFFECPELFELAVDGSIENGRWVLMGANAEYVVGKFDGMKFTPEHAGKYKVFSGPIYAGQCFSRAPGGRVIYIGWARINIPMPATFTQGYTLPIEFTLKTTKDGIRMFANPVKELDQLRDKALVDLSGETAAQGCTVDAPDQEYDILLTLKKTGDNGGCAMSLGGQKVKLPALTGDSMNVRVLVDRTTVEVVEGDGAMFKLEPRQGTMGKPIGKIEIKPDAGVVVEKIQIYKMKSALPGA